VAAPVNRLEAGLRTLLADLAGTGRPVALVGGLAVSTHAEPRLTRDVDLVVAVPGDAEAERVVQALTAAGYETLALVEREALGRLATVRLRLPRDTARGVVADLLFASSGVEDVVVAEAERVEVFPGLTIPVARIGHLIALKLLSRDDRLRPQDAADLRALRAVADEAETRRARTAIRSIAERGFARGRDLEAALADLLRGP
jgi:predicted nucleotidyltransferase